ncbi:hypothetical protein [Actinomadura hibisca]|uniref:hypothetical protein n=1 Tax=Actinomadura hibisca TaxID=68565 RepID=UPI000833C6E8|nr:hypothetical protein [Actinomadura hibisca]
MNPEQPNGDRPARPFFAHARGFTAAAGQPLQHATRYLAAGTYIRRAFEDLVISEFLHDRHRAIVPSYGFDLEVVLRHALRARRLRLYRDLILIGVWVVCWVLSPLAAILVGATLATGVVAAVLGSRIGGGMLPSIMVVAAVIVVPPLVGGLGVAVTMPLAELGLIDAGDALSGDIAGPAFVVSALLLILSLAGVVFGHLALVLRALSHSLAPGATGPGPAVSASEAPRLARVASAQRGNVTLYAGTNPFLGGGGVRSRAWSIVLELDRPAAERLTGPRPSAPVDPVVMHQRVRDAMRAMRDELPPADPGARPLPFHERVVSLVIDDHIVGRGLCDHRGAAPGGAWVAHPLLDPGGPTPYSLATGPTIDAIKRHPQGTLRYYQRISIGAQSQPVTASDGRLVMPAEEQDFSANTFVYLAVEGRMLYGQFVTRALPPIRADFRIVDNLPSWGTTALVREAVRVGWSEAGSAALLAVPRALQAGWGWLGEQLGLGAPNPAAQPMYDYGARISIREVAAAKGFATYLQELDVTKYTRMVQQRVNDALLDYLDRECGIDVSAYRAQAEQIMNQGVIITGGNVSGQVAAGGRIRQQQTGRPAGGTS